MKPPPVDMFTEHFLRDAIRQGLEVLNQDGAGISASELTARVANIYMGIVGNFAGYCPRCREAVPIRSIEDITESLPGANARPL